ncbi:MAG: hypothetical protein LQ346_005936 [Caloplaca aetnensis]|nr:MAG: hypothetical protein LQ346_005936 [Caloplaca aetnensis]
MGRRKIEIKAIKDDRNRSVTFLKRKGGLFKKAHELSVLCSVDVAVIIFGHNKKLYEYSSGDINETIGRFQYYGGAHEHKGPADFVGRGNLDDDDDDEMGSPPPEDQMQQEQLQPDQVPRNHGLPPHVQSQPPYMRHPGQSASPPIQNGVPFQHRNHTPQPQMISRPQSRNMVQPPNFPSRPPDFPPNQPQHQHQVTQGPHGTNGYAYVHNPSVYNPHGMQGQAQQYYAQHSQAQPPQMPHAYMHEPRRQSMPPTFPQQERSQPQPPQQQQQPQQHQPAMRSPPQPKQEPQPENEPNRLAKPVQPAKSRSIFTPIDDSRSLLAQHWGLGKSSDAREVKMEKENRSQSVDVGAIQPRNKPLEGITSPPKHANTMPQRNSLPSETQPTRTNSAQIGGKRPRLKVQIPSEQSDGGSATAESSPRQSGGTADETPAKASTDASQSSGVVLPPPSPSASAILSAGAQGPPNPFARPHPPTHNPNGGSYSSNNTNNNIDTPMSALPSRFVADGLLPSPSSFYPEWGLGRAGDNSNLLPSPLTFQTPIVGNGPSFLREEEGERKRKSPEADAAQQETGNLKRVKT